MSYPVCLVCGKKIKVKGTGRPPRYCTDQQRCKEKARRNRNKDRNRAMRATVDALEPGEPAYATNGVESDRVCHVCDTNPATLGPPGNPIICEPCASR